jgi:hypothetical protein
MMVILERSVPRPILETSTPSIQIDPEAGSRMRKRARVSEDFPALKLKQNASRWHCP